MYVSPRLSLPPASTASLMSAWIERRASYSSDSSSSPRAVGWCTKHCWMSGSAASAIGPSTSLRCGTARQPSTSRPRRFACASKKPLTCSASAASVGRKVIATPHESEEWPFRCPSASKSSHGTDVSTPEPSPDTESPPQPPRCSMQPSATSARAMMSCRRRPFWSARNPTPHASRSPTSDGGPGYGAPISPARRPSTSGGWQDC
mmetsp:Transcript_37922/g.96301  ORF Transcript_37922/g.96301 Transcript_37922/m.96301 type:complete len:205 (+) Transcript_37922:1427-2041(+)